MHLLGIVGKPKSFRPLLEEDKQPFLTVPITMNLFRIIYIVLILSLPFPDLARGKSNADKTSDGKITVGPSATTIYCQNAVYQDAKTGVYKSIDKPIDLKSFKNLEKYGDTFRGVTPVVLPPGVVTPAWKDKEGQKRGEAILWVPDGIEKNSSRLLYVHGGSWLAGSPATDGYAPFGAKMAKMFQKPTLVIDYTLAPIGNFSVILKDVGMAAHFLATHEPRDLLTGNMTSTPVKDAPLLFISGDSAGGGTAVSALVAQASPSGLPQANGATLAGGVAYSPWINLRSNVPTYYSELFGIHQEGEVLLGDINFGFGATPEEIVASNVENAKLYSNNLKDPVANPFYAPKEWFKNLPPMSLHVGTPELLQADTNLFATRAAKAGAPHVEAHMFDGMWHVFQMYSQGCGSGAPLMLAESSLEFSKAFYDKIVEESSMPEKNNSFCFVPHYEDSNGEDSARGLVCA